MKTRNEKGQIQLSFGMIFSIIIVIATIAIAFYVIVHFLNLSNCNKIGMFYSSLQTSIDSCWQGGTCQEIFKADLPSGINMVCFGNVSQEYDTQFEEQALLLKQYSRNNENVLLYPLTKSCDSNLVIYKLNHVNINGFFCVPVKLGKGSVKLLKTNSESSVRLSKP